MNAKFLRTLRELGEGREVWLVVHHPVRGEIRRICVRPLEPETSLPAGAVVLVRRGRQRDAMPPWVAEVKSFSFAPDLHGNERLCVSGPSEDPHPRWVGRCDIVGVQVSDQPHQSMPA